MPGNLYGVGIEEQERPRSDAHSKGEVVSHEAGVTVVQPGRGEARDSESSPRYFDRNVTRRTLIVVDTTIVFFRVIVYFWHVTKISFYYR